MSVWLSIAASVVVVFLSWNLYRRFGADRIAAFIEKRRATSRMVSQGEFVDGNRHLEVALSVTQSTFFYENADMQAPSICTGCARSNTTLSWPPARAAVGQGPAAALQQPDLRVRAARMTSWRAGT